MANGIKKTDTVVSYPIPTDIVERWRKSCKANDIYFEKDMAALMLVAPYLSAKLHLMLVGVIEGKTPWSLVEPALKTMQRSIEDSL